MNLPLIRSIWIEEYSEQTLVQILSWVRECENVQTRAPTKPCTNGSGRVSSARKIQPSEREKQPEEDWATYYRRTPLTYSPRVTAWEWCCSRFSQRGHGLFSLSSTSEESTRKKKLKISSIFFFFFLLCGCQATMCAVPPRWEKESQVQRWLTFSQPP